jgi:hypothetical protein
MPDRGQTRAVVAAAFILVWLAIPGAMGATHRGSNVPDQVALEMSYQRAPTAGAYDQLVARLLSEDGSPVVGVEVEFQRELEFLGPRLIKLASATTDAYGTARVTVDTRETSVKIRARFLGNSQYQPAEATSEITMPVGAPGVPAPAEEGRTDPSLAAIAAVMPPLLAAIALAIWLVLLGLSAATVLAIRRARPSTPAQEEKRT